VAGPYSWVASGEGFIVLCVLSSLLLFLCFCWFPVSCSSQLVFEVFTGVHWLALIRVRFLFLLFVSSSWPGWMPMCYKVPTILPADHQPATSSVHYTTSCKHSLVLLGMGEIIDRNMLS